MGAFLAALGAVLLFVLKAVGILLLVVLILLVLLLLCLLFVCIQGLYSLLHSLTCPKWCYRSLLLQRLYILRPVLPVWQFRNQFRDRYAHLIHLC